MSSPSKPKGMVKHGNVVVGDTRCDVCGSLASSVGGGKAFCREHMGTKRAEADDPLKGAGERLAGRHQG
jgi:hypothetical protein